MSAAFLFMVSVLFFTAGCQLNPITYDTPLMERRATLYEYPWCHDQPSGIAVSSQGRIFISFPRWQGNPAYSVVEVMPDGMQRPFPDTEWNLWGKPEEGRPDAHFISAQGMFIDSNDTLWILDSAYVNLKSVWPKGAKLVGIDLATNKVTNILVFDDSVIRHDSYLRKVCVDRWKNVAYVSDAGSGAIIVANLENGQSRRLLADTPSTKAEPGFVMKIDGKELLDEHGEPLQYHVDGLALDPDGSFLYYHALTGRKLYRIRTEYLNNPLMSREELAKHVESLADTGPVDGMVMDGEHNLFLAKPDESAVKRFSIYDGSLVTIAQEQHISWPDSLGLSSDNYLYITASQFDRLPYFNRGKDYRRAPYLVFRVSKIFPPPP